MSTIQHDAPTFSAIPVRLLTLLIRGYQRAIAPLIPPCCRFYPSCSNYAITALHVHGLFRGLWLTAGRLLRCAPWHPGGLDPVPPRKPRPGRSAAAEE